MELQKQTPTLLLNILPAPWNSGSRLIAIFKTEIKLHSSVFELVKMLALQSALLPIYLFCLSPRPFFHSTVVIHQLASLLQTIQIYRCKLICTTLFRNYFVCCVCILCIVLSFVYCVIILCISLLLHVLYCLLCIVL